MTKKQVINTLLKKIQIELQSRNILNILLSKKKQSVKQIVDISLLIDHILYRNPDKSSYGEEVVIVWYTIKKDRELLPDCINPSWLPIPVKWFDHSFDIKTIDVNEYYKKFIGKSIFPMVKINIKKKGETNAKRRTKNWRICKIS